MTPSFKKTVCATAVLLVACSTAPTSTSMLEETRIEYQNARSNPDVRQYASVELAQSLVSLDAANTAATQRDSAEQVDKLAYLAKQKVVLAEEVAKQKVAEASVAEASKQREQIRLNERTRETDTANANANAAQQATVVAQQATVAAVADTKEAQDRAARLEQELRDLHAQKTDHGIVLTFGDILFSTNESNMNPSGVAVAQKLATLLRENPDRSVVINGFTDSTGTVSYNQGLSERRAGAVSDILTNAGVDRQRIAVHGYGPGRPIADNNTAQNRQLNRRVEITLSDAGGNFVGATGSSMVNSPVAEKDNK